MQKASETHHGAVRSLCLQGAAVRGDEDGRHEPQGAEALGHDVRLHVAVVVLQDKLLPQRQRRHRYERASEAFAETAGTLHAHMNPPLLLSACATMSSMRRCS